MMGSPGRVHDPPPLLPLPPRTPPSLELARAHTEHQESSASPHGGLLAEGLQGLEFGVECLGFRVRGLGLGV